MRPCVIVDSVKDNRYHRQYEGNSIYPDHLQIYFVTHRFFLQTSSDYEDSCKQDESIHQMQSDAYTLTKPIHGCIICREVRINWCSCMIN